MKRIGWRLRRKYRLRQVANAMLYSVPLVRKEGIKKGPIEKARVAAEEYIRRLDSVAKK